MKTIIVAINSKYIHASLACRYLKVNCNQTAGEVDVLEFSINDNMELVLKKICLEKPNTVAFSCYIWNIEYVLKLVGDLKKVYPNIIIILGGPEVSFDAEKLLKENPCVDFIISGEGEFAFKNLLGYLNDCKGYGIPRLSGVTYRENGNILSEPQLSIENLDELKTPYTEEMKDVVINKIIYFEASRGCPFNCSYCISSTFKGVRFFPLEYIKTQLSYLMTWDVRQIKFVDRTFNANKPLAKQIFIFIIENSPEDKNFHFEAAADLFDDEMFDILSKAPRGLIQFEIGVQTTNYTALDAVRRKTDIEKVFKNIKKLKALNNMHIHLDLIAGLPFENYNSLMNSFDSVYNLKPHKFQLGFLKMLKGSEIRDEADLYQYKFRDYPPYEVLSNMFISYEEFLEIKGIEELVERYYNSKRFDFTLDFLIENLFKSPTNFFREFYCFSLEKGYLDRSVASRDLYDILFEFLKEYKTLINLDIVNEFLKFDYLCSDNTNNLPKSINRIINAELREKQFKFLKDEKNIKEYFPNFYGMNAKQIIKHIHFEIFPYNVQTGNNGEVVFIFDYTSKDRVSERYRYIVLKSLK